MIQKGACVKTQISFIASLIFLLVFLFFAVWLSDSNEELCCYAYARPNMTTAFDCCWY